MKHLDIRVTGVVQGVYFRKTAKEQAQKLSITGLARNEPDGTVHIEAEGGEEELDKFVKWCKSGSPAAEVHLVKVEEGALKHYRDFTTQ